MRRGRTPRESTAPGSPTECLANPEAPGETSGRRGDQKKTSVDKASIREHFTQRAGFGANGSLEYPGLAANRCRQSLWTLQWQAVARLADRGGTHRGAARDLGITATRGRQKNHPGAAHLPSRALRLRVKASKCARSASVTVTGVTGRPFRFLPQADRRPGESSDIYDRNWCYTTLERGLDRN